LQGKLIDAFTHRPKDGWEAEHNRNANHPAHESMATIGG
jgi:cyclic pyranopterin phosphate synthase